MFDSARFLIFLEAAFLLAIAPGLACCTLLRGRWREAARGDDRAWELPGSGGIEVS